MYCEFPEFGRCCFCLPLRRGVLIFGYLNILFSAFLIGVYSYWINSDAYLMYHGAVLNSNVAAALCIVVYCLEVLFNCVLLYGAHRKIQIYIKIFYYYAIITTVAAVFIQIVELFNARFIYILVDSLIMTFAGLMLQLYLLILVRSLLKKLERGGAHAYENQLQQIVTGERKIEENGVYNQNTVIPNEDA